MSFYLENFPPENLCHNVHEFQILGIITVLLFKPNYDVLNFSDFFMFKIQNI